MFRLRLSGLLAGTALFACFSAAAESISFHLSLEHSRLTVTLLGDSSAYFPSVLRMLQDGRWEPLPPISRLASRSELRPGDTFELEWPERRPLQNPGSMDRMQPIMVRYFEQIGVGLGQISFFEPPSQINDLLQAGYTDGLLRIRADREHAHNIRATWVLWPREDGVRMLLEPFRLDHVQPSARRIDWQSSATEVRLDTGAGQPEAVLLHETDHGHVLQTVTGGLPRIHQRAPWMDASSTFYHLALIALAAAVIALFALFVRTHRHVSS